MDNGEYLNKRRTKCYSKSKIMLQYSLLLFMLKHNNQLTPIKKQHLPEKICAACARPFTWRKKWEKAWDQVRYCSERCKRAGSKVGR